VYELNRQLSELYTDCCGHAIELEVNLSDDLSTAIEEMVQEVWRLQGTDGSINQSVTKFFTDKIWGGVVKGFGSDISGVDYETPDYNMLTALQENVWHFSAAKNYAQLRELSDALLDADGRLRTFEQFKEAAGLINQKFMKTWLRTEYNLAVTGSQMAGKWVDIERNAKTLPLLQFDAVLDGQTTDLCRSLNGTVLRWDHAFWKTYYLPNHFGERSTVRQLATGKITPEHKIPSADIPKMFRTNLAQKGLIFPEDHAYFIGIPNDVKNFKPE
jgi:hypothetical protein